MEVLPAAAAAAASMVVAVKAIDARHHSWF
jgi:hypothetical protein